MKNLCQLVFLFSFLLSFGQNISLNDTLPIDSNLRKGVLPNGMTYYIYRAENLKGLANYYFVQNGGSILEDDDQSGLSHFLEHMAFNGTKNFPGKAIIDTLRANGIPVGGDFNAFANYDSTIYFFKNLPTSASSLDLGLNILLDWSSNITLDEKEIDLERDVIQEEKRSKNGANRRVFDQTAGTKFGHSKYAQRSHLGDMEVVKNFKYQTLRNFYNDWYRPDLQAIVVLGDVDIDAVEEKIKAKFSSIPAHKNPREREYEVIKDNKDLDYAIAVDKEIAVPRINFNIRHKKPKIKNTVGYLQNNLLNKLVVNALNNRIKTILKKTDTPAKSISFSFRDLTILYNSFEVGIFPKENKQEAAFALAMTELNRAIKFGFSENEMKMAIANINEDYTGQMEFLRKDPDLIIAQKIQKNFLEDVPVVDMEVEYQIASFLMNDFKPEDLLQRIQALYTKENRNLIVIDVKEENCLTKGLVEKAINNAENDTSLKPYKEEKEEEKSLAINTTLKKGRIVAKSENTDLNFTTFKLSNGIEVHYKFSDWDKEKIRFRATSKGGSSLIEPEYLLGLRTIQKTIENSGVGGLTGADLLEFKSKRKINLQYNINDAEESIAGLSSTAQFETLLQLVNLRFNSVKLEEATFTKELQKLKTKLKRNKKSLSRIKQDSITHAVYGRDNPYKRVLDSQIIEGLSFDQVNRIYEKRFGNPYDFAFYIVGDIPKEYIVPLLEKYIASLPTTKKVKEVAKELPAPQWVERTIVKDIFLEMNEPLGDVRINIKKKLTNIPKSDTYIRILGAILQERHTELLREAIGGVYSVYTSGYFLPKLSEARIGIRFSCNPELTDVLIDTLYADLEKVKKGRITKEEFSKAIAELFKEKKEQKKSNFRDLLEISNYISSGEKRVAAGGPEAEVSAITLEGLKDFSRKVLEDFDSYKIVFRPKQDEKVK